MDNAIEKTLEKGPRRKKLLEFRRMLLRTETINKKEVLIPESRIIQLDELKKSVDVFLKPKVGDAPIDNETKEIIRGVKNDILKRVDQANLDYQKARQTWAGDAEALDKLTNKTRLKSLADLKGNQNFVPAVNQLSPKTRKNPARSSRSTSASVSKSKAAQPAGCGPPSGPVIQPCQSL